jgi:hypothetical protein
LRPAAQVNAALDGPGQPTRAPAACGSRIRSRGHLLTHASPSGASPGTITQHQTRSVWGEGSGYLASWHFHNHISLALQSSVGIERRLLEAFHLGCFGPDLVEASSEKTRTHFTLDMATVPFYPFSLRRFRRWSSPYAALSVRHRWFYHGYAAHLLVDRCWMHDCAYPFLAKRLFRGIASMATYEAYYGDMLAYDNYHRYLTAQDSYDLSLRMLREVDPAGLFPPMLAPPKVGDLIEVLERTRGSKTPTYQARYIPWWRVSRFVERSLGVCRSYLWRATRTGTRA